MRALVIERNKMVARRLVRYLTCAGYKAAAVEEPGDAMMHLDGVWLLAADAFDGAAVVEILRSHPEMRGILWTAEPLNRCLRYAVETPQISNILGRKDFDSTPRPWELVMIARRLLRPGQPGAKFSAFLDWGFTGFQEKLASTAERDRVVARVQKFVDHLGVPSRVTEQFGELAHEMIMNAMYDAPVDASGRPKYAADRKAQLDLPEPDRPTFKLASDGSQLVVQVSDPFGRLERHHVFDGLVRGLAGGEMDRSHGGAGLGMLVCHNSTVAMFYDVQRHARTEVTGIFDLDLNLREFRTLAKSLHFFKA